MGKQKISGFLIASIFLILFFLLIIFYFSELNPNINVEQEAEETTIKELNENIRAYIGKKVLISGTIISSEGDYMIIGDEGGEFTVTNPGSLIRGNSYELKGIVKSRPAFYYRYYEISYYLDVSDTKEI